jgi:small subunit ribosomal protein S14
MKKNLNFKILTNLNNSIKKENIFFLNRIINNNSKLPLSLQLAIFLNPKFKLKSFFSNKSFIKFKRQCLITWRTRSVYSFFDLSRIVIRELSSFGFIRGIKKSSW